MLSLAPTAVAVAAAVFHCRLPLSLTHSHSFIHFWYCESIMAESSHHWAPVVVVVDTGATAVATAAAVGVIANLRVDSISCAG